MEVTFAPMFIGYTPQQLNDETSLLNHQDDGLLSHLIPDIDIPPPPQPITQPITRSIAVIPAFEPVQEEQKEQKEQKEQGVDEKEATNYFRREDPPVRVSFID